MAVKKATFTLPSDLVRKIKKRPEGKRSRFVKRTIEKELNRQDTLRKEKAAGAAEDAIAALERLRKRPTWGENLALEIKRHRIFIKRYSGRAKSSDFSRS